MANIISIHSFRRGTGKSSLTANLAALLAIEGWSVGVIDTNLETPSLGLLFDLDESRITYSLNDYLWGKCAIEQAVYEVTPRLSPAIKGRIWLIPASTAMNDIKRALREGYDVSLLNYGCYELIDALGLDILLIDTQAGMHAKSLVSIAIANILVIILRLDRQDYQGTGVLLDLARRMVVPPARILVVNDAPSTLDFVKIKLQLEQSYECEVTGVLPHSDELMILTSADLFVLRYPDHPITTTFKQIAARLVAN